MSSATRYSRLKLLIRSSIKSIDELAKSKERREILKKNIFIDIMMNKKYLALRKAFEKIFVIELKK